jgi:hypothetical protein
MLVLAASMIAQHGGTIPSRMQLYIEREGHWHFMTVLQTTCGADPHGKTIDHNIKIK